MFSRQVNRWSPTLWSYFAISCILGVYSFSCFIWGGATTSRPHSPRILLWTRYYVCVLAEKSQLPQTALRLALNHLIVWVLMCWMLRHQKHQERVILRTCYFTAVILRPADCISRSHYVRAETRMTPSSLHNQNVKFSPRSTFKFDEASHWSQRLLSCVLVHCIDCITLI